MNGAGVRAGWLVMLALVALPASGCLHGPYRNNGQPLFVPPNDIPGELNKIQLPPYVIEPPDQLLIEVVAILEDPDSIASKDKDKDKDKKKDEKAKEFKAYSLPVQPISGQFSVRPDGSVFLGIWGSVPVAGLTLQQAAEAVRQHIAQQEDPTKPGTGGFKVETIRVVLDVLQYNSKRYYVVTDGAGNGEQVAAFPITGSETVFDALANIGGLPPVASKRQIWVARRTPHAGQPEQILPVDWVAITQHGITTTNYQVMPGDRIYVKSQRLIRIDTAISRVLTPIERIFGFTLLGANTVNQIQGRGNGFGGN
jgi:polysaccharide biosynthesis/export protein